MKLLLTIILIVCGINLFAQPSLNSSVFNEGSADIAIPDYIDSDAMPLIKSHCFCKGAPYQGESPKNINGVFADLGTIASFGSFSLANRRKKCADKCSRLISMNSSYMDNDKACRSVKKTGQQRVVGYYKVGTQDWRICHTRFVKCCSSGGVITCPDGWNPEPNFVDKCSKYVCDPVLKNYNGKLRKDNGEYWGFIYNDQLAQLTQGSLSPVIYRSCH